MRSKPPQQGPARIASGSFAAVIRAFMSSEKFRNYSPSTRDGWGRELLLAELPETLGALSTHTIRPALVMAFLDGYADRPGKQRAALAALKQVERWAIVRDLLMHPITTGVQVEPSTDGHIPWSDDQVELAERNARVEMARAITLAANTGQRGSDVVRMRWSDIEDFRGRPGIHVKQKKTGRKLWVPFTQSLMTAMASWEKRPGYLITGPSGKPWTRMALTKAWIAERRDNVALKPHKAAGLVHARTARHSRCAAVAAWRQHPPNRRDRRHVGEDGCALLPALVAARKRFGSDPLSGGNAA